MDLTSLSLGKLNTLNQRIAREIEVRERVGKADVIKKLRKLAAAEGFTLEELLSLPQQAQATAPAKAKRPGRRLQSRKPMHRCLWNRPPCNLSEYTVLLQSGGWR
jgi:hypothetical protein